MARKAMHFFLLLPSCCSTITVIVTVAASLYVTQLHHCQGIGKLEIGELSDASDQSASGQKGTRH
jgi:hypothetical protein